MSDLGPWRIYRPTLPTLSAMTLQLAKEKADGVYRSGFVELEHETTGENWVRDWSCPERWRQRRPALPGHLAGKTS